MKTKEERYAVRRAWAQANPEKIKEYGKRDWAKHKEKRINDHKKWVEENRELVLEGKRKWYQSVKDTPELKARKRKWYLAHREEILREKKEKNDARLALNPRIFKTEEEKRVKNRAWVIANREKINAAARKWRDKNLSEQRGYAKRYYVEKLSPKVQFQRLHASAKQRNYVVEITFEEFSEMVSKPCTYCGETEHRRGIDRVDNLKGYTIENSAPCCKVCNYMKRSLGKTDFIKHAKRIYNYNFK